MQQSVRIESETNRTGDIFARFVLAALLLEQIEHHAPTAVRGADILRHAALGMIYRVRVDLAEMQTFQMLKHLVEALLGHSAKEFNRVNAIAKIHFTRRLSQSRRLRRHADRPMIHRSHTVH